MDELHVLVANGFIWLTGSVGYARFHAVNCDATVNNS